MTSLQRVITACLLLLIVVGQVGRFVYNRQRSITWLQQSRIEAAQPPENNQSHEEQSEENNQQDVLQHDNEDCSLIHVNVATHQDLMTLPGIGPVYAENIIEQRSIAVFRRLEDLLLVRGIGPKRLEVMKPLICLAMPKSDAESK